MINTSSIDVELIILYFFPYVKVSYNRRLTTGRITVQSQHSVTDETLPSKLPTFPIDPTPKLSSMVLKML